MPVFEWRAEDFAALVATCRNGAEYPYIMKYMPRRGRVLEAGCGLARYVAVLHDQGFRVAGVEWNPDTVAMVRRIRPDLAVLVGDVLALPFADDSLAGIVSLGVIEHFTAGPQAALREMRRVLQPGCHAVITIPVQNTLRRMKRTCGFYRAKDVLRRLLGRIPPPSREPDAADLPRLGRECFVWREKGEFFEYRFTRRQFEAFLTECGFTIVASAPIGQIDGLYHDFGPPLVRFHQWRFEVHPFGRLLDRWLSRVPGFHNHMHMCVVRKD